MLQESNFPAIINVRENEYEFDEDITYSQQDGTPAHFHRNVVREIVNEDRHIYVRELHLTAVDVRLPPLSGCNRDTNWYFVQTRQILNIICFSCHPPLSSVCHCCATERKRPLLDCRVFPICTSQTLNLKSPPNLALTVHRQPLVSRPRPRLVYERLLLTHVLIIIELHRLKQRKFCYVLDITVTSKSRLNGVYTGKKWRKFCVRLKIASLNGRKSSRERFRYQCRTVGYKNWRTVSAIKIPIINIAETSLSCVNRLCLDSRNNQRYNCGNSCANSLAFTCKFKRNLMLSIYKCQTASRSNQPRSSVFVVRAALVGRLLEIPSVLRSTIYLNDFYAHVMIARAIRTVETK
ncbi:hypothetical protein J6590_006812 [Homalodisca vitripennis]|nr:hypothetical protein J6590_006812 [Homalodisca vitripennis]